MIIINKKPRLFRCYGITVNPGRNEFGQGTKNLQKFLDHPSVKIRLENGEFVKDPSENKQEKSFKDLSKESKKAEVKK
jgi:hypothetical protein